MNILSHQLKPFTPLVSEDPMPKKDFLILAHQFALATQRNLICLVEMIQFSNVYRKENEIVLE
jgi:hypothetical protein